MKDVQATCLKPSKLNIRHFKTRNFFPFSNFMGQFCPPAFLVRIRIQPTTMHVDPYSSVSAGSIPWRTNCENTDVRMCSIPYGTSKPLPGRQHLFTRDSSRRRLISSTEYKQSGDCQFLAYIPSSTFSLRPSRTKLQCTLLLRGQIHSLYFTISSLP